MHPVKGRKSAIPLARPIFSDGYVIEEGSMSSPDFMTQDPT